MRGASVILSVHSELEGVWKVPIKSEYTGQCGMKWTIISHNKHWNPMRASKDMATLICKFWEPWKTNFIFLHFRWCWYRFWCFFDFQGHHLFICCPIKLNYGNPEIENDLMFLKIHKNSYFTCFLDHKSSHNKNFFYYLKLKSDFSCF